MPLTLETSDTIEAGDCPATILFDETIDGERETIAALDYDDVVQSVETATDETAASSVKSPALVDADFRHSRAVPEPERQLMQRAREVERARDRLCAATMTEMRCKSALKIAKMERELAAEELSKLMMGEPVVMPTAASTREEKKPPAPPTTDVPPVETKPGEPPPVAEPATNPAPAAGNLTGINAPNAAWRFHQIDQLEGLPPGIIKSLADAGLDTVGKLAEYTKSGKQLTDIKGIGQAKVEKIEKACEDFWKMFEHEKTEAVA